MTRRKKPDLSYIAEELRPFAVPIDSIELDPKNARLHPEKNRVSNVLLPVITTRLASRTVIGSTCPREASDAFVELARELGWSHIAATFRDYTEQEAAAWAIAHNRSAELAEWDFEVLGETILEFPDVDWEAVGFDAADFDAFGLEYVDADGETTTVGEHERELPGEGEDELPETPAESITQIGEVVELGPHTLHCCDCMDLLRSLPDNSIDAIVTDPPYGLSPDGRARTWDDIEALRREGNGPRGGFLGREWDAGVPGISWARECLRVLKPGGYIAAYSATRTVHRLTVAIEDAGFEIILPARVSVIEVPRKLSSGPAGRCPLADPRAR